MSSRLHVSSKLIYKSFSIFNKYLYNCKTGLTTLSMYVLASNSSGPKSMHIKKWVRILVKESPQVNFTLEDLQQQIDYRLLNLDKIHIDPVSLKRLRFTTGELTPDQATVIIDQ